MAFQPPFKLEIKHNQKSISFGPRLPNEIGRDILAVKSALGLVSLASDQAPTQSSAPLDSQNWQDCSTGKGMTITQASTYDTKLKNALINFQIKNQFLIVSYLIEKFGIRDLIGQVAREVEFNVIENNIPNEYNRSLIRQIESSILLFDSELGILGEATLAVLHGWLPHTTLTNAGYVHLGLRSYDTICDIIHIARMREIDMPPGSAGASTQTFRDMVEAGICVPNGLYYNDVEKLNKYLGYVSSKINWTRIVGEYNPFRDNRREQKFQFGAVEYVRKDRESSQSLLYAAAVGVIENMEQIEEDYSRELGSMSSEQKIENLKRMYFPDPFIDPPPFPIDDERIGYFYETDYELSPDNLPSQSEDVIREMEQKALEEVFQILEKPSLWYLNKSAELSNGNELERTQIAYFAGAEPPQPTHNGYYPFNGQTREISDFNVDEEYSKYKQYSELKRRIKFNNNARKEAKKIVQDYERPNSEYYLATGPVQEYDIDEETSRFAPGAAREKIDDFYDSKNREIRIVMDNWPPHQFNAESFYVVSLDNDVSVSNGYAQYWRDIDSFGTTEPLIRFVEYRTPTLRPSQKYRALFYINKEKLDLIVNAVALEPSAPASRSSATTTEEELCADDNSSQTLRRYQEYKNHAIRTRNEIVKKFREESKKLKYQNEFDSARLDLGSAGPFDLNDAFNPFGGGLVSGQAYTEKVFSSLIGEEGSLLSSIGVTGTDVDQLNSVLKENDPLKTNSRGLPTGTSEQDENLNKIKITLEDLRVRVKIMAKDILEAGEELKKGGIQFDPGSNFRANIEANKVQQFLLEFENVLAEEFPDKPESAEITFEFERALNDQRIGPKVGKQITWCAVKAPPSNTSEDDPGTNDSSLLTDVTVDIKQDKFTTENLSRPRTVNYISRIFDMTTRYLPEGSLTKSFFEDSRGACKDLGIDLKKTLGISYIGKYTSGLKITPDPSEESFEPVKEWWSNNFADPFDQWVTTSGNNLGTSFSSLDSPKRKGQDYFSETDALKMMGEACEWEDFYEALFDKLDFASLLCDYIKCIKLPGFDIKLPSFHLPPIPKIPIIGWMGEIYKFFIENFKEILNRLLCTAGKLLIDKMAIPFCEDQLREFIAAGSSAGPIWNEALADSLLLTGFPGQKKEQAKDFFEDSVSILTGEELCKVLRGERLDQATMTALSKLAGNRDLSSELNSEEDIANFFGVLGAYIPFEICEKLESPQIKAKDCEDTLDLVSAIRNKLLSDDPTLDEEQLNQALDIARKNREDVANQLRSFSSSDIGSMAPNFFEMGNPNAIVSDYPPYLKDQMDNTMKAIFEPARSSYVSSLTSFIPSMRILSPDSPRAGDDRYDAEETMRLESALHQLASYTHYCQRHIAHNVPAAQEAEEKIRVLKEVKEQLESPDFLNTAFEDVDRIIEKIHSFTNAGNSLDINDDSFYIRTYGGADRFETGNPGYNKLKEASIAMNRRVQAAAANGQLDEEAARRLNIVLLMIGQNRVRMVSLLNNFGRKVIGFPRVIFEGFSEEQLNATRRILGLEFNFLRMGAPEYGSEYRELYAEATSWNREGYADVAVWTSTQFVDNQIGWSEDRWAFVIQDFSTFLTNVKAVTQYTGDGPTNFKDSLRANLDLDIEKIDTLIGSWQEQIMELTSPPKVTVQLASLLFAIYASDYVRGDMVFNHYKANTKREPEFYKNNPQPVLFGRKDGRAKRFKYGTISGRSLEFYDIGNEVEDKIKYDEYIDSLLDPADNSEYSLKIRWYHTPEGTGVRLPYLSTTGILGWVMRSRRGNLSIYEALEEETKQQAAKAETARFVADYKDEEPDSPRLTRLVVDRIQELTRTINEIIERRSNDNIELHLPYIREAFKWSSEADRERENRNNQGRGGFVYYSNSRNEIVMNFQAGVYSPKLMMKELEKDGNFDRYDITVQGDFFLNQSPDESVTFRYCDEIPTNEVRNRLTLGERGGNNFTKREAWASFLFDKIAATFGSSRRVSRLDRGEREEVLRLLSEKSYEEITNRVMEQVTFSLFNSRFFDQEYSEELDDRIAGNPVYERSCVTNKFGLSEASNLSFDKVILGDPAAEIALESALPENSPYNRDFDSPGPFEKAMKTIAVKAFIRACLIETLLKGGIAYASWDIASVVTDKFFVDYVLTNVESELNQNQKIKHIWKSVMEKSESIPSPKQALRSFVVNELRKFPDYSREVFNPDQPKRDFENWELGDILPMVDAPWFGKVVSNIPGSERTYSFNSSSGRTGLPYSFLGQRGFHIEEYVVVVSISEDSQQAISQYNLPEFPGSVGHATTISYFQRKLEEWYAESARQIMVVTDGNFGDPRVAQIFSGVLSGIKIDHRCRLMLLEVPKDKHIPLDFQEGPHAVEGDPGPVQDIVQRYFGNKDALAGKSRVVKKGYVNVRVGDDGFGPHAGAITIDLARYSRDISPANCAALWQWPRPKIGDNLKEESTRRYMRQELAKKKDFQFVLDTVFPIRRFMAMSSVYSTSILSGYSAVPDVMNAAKIMISAIAEIADTPRSLQSGLNNLNPTSMQDYLKKNFPSDPSDPSCLDFPDLGKEFFEKFFSDLWELFKQLPSILLRGIAFQLDPGYKEMRNHYLNCDIDKLKIERLAGQTVDKSLVNGLDLRGEERGTNNGRYATLFSAPIDIGYSLSNPWKFPRRMERTILKIISYVYSGNRPFVDLNTVFKIPCKNIDENYLENEKYDFGKYGRYGHPLSPFGIFALMTPELKMDKRLKQGKCRPIPTIPCEDVDEETT